MPSHGTTRFYDLIPQPGLYLYFCMRFCALKWNCPVLRYDAPAGVRLVLLDEVLCLHMTTRCWILWFVPLPGLYLYGYRRFRASHGNRAIARFYSINAPAGAIFVFLHEVSCHHIALPGFIV